MYRRRQAPRYLDSGVQAMHTGTLPETKKWKKVLINQALRKSAPCESEKPFFILFIVVCIVCIFGLYIYILYIIYITYTLL